MPADPSPAAAAARPCNPRPSARTGPPARAVAARPRQCRPRRSPRGAPLAGPAQSSESVHPSTPPSRGFQRWRLRLSETPRRCSSAPIGGPPGLPGPRPRAAGRINGGVQCRGPQTASFCGSPAGAGRRHFPAGAAWGARQAAGAVRRTAQQTAFAPVPRRGCRLEGPGQRPSPHAPGYAGPGGEGSPGYPDYFAQLSGGGSLRSRCCRT